MKNKILILIFFLVIILTTLGIYIFKTTLNEKSEFKESEIIYKNTRLEDVKFKNNKINIYIFWGEGCPHCEELFTFFENIKLKYGKYFTVYGFEVWKNQENGEIMDQFLMELNGEPKKRSVPYYIIGDQAFSGYISSMDEKLIKIIKNKYRNRKKINKFEEIFS